MSGYRIYGDSDDFINILISNQTSQKIAYLLNQLI